MALSMIRRPASKLAFRIYLFGVIQFVVVLTAMVALLEIVERRPFPFPGTVRFLAETVAASEGDRVTIDQMATRLRSSLRCSIAVYDQNDRLVAHDPLVQPPPSRAALPPLPADLTTPVPMRNGTTWHLVFLVPPMVPKLPVLLSWPAVMLIVIGLSSLLLARSISRPLRRMTKAAVDFGAGKLDARVRLDRSDELGQVAKSFDQMADRVARALRVEKELLANVSHELRTPLQRIHIAVELAAEGNAITAQESLKEIGEDLAELERIVEDVLTATRLSLREGTPTAAYPPIRPELVDMKALLDKSTARFRAAHPQRPLRVSIADDLPSLTVDAVLVRRVIDNLLDNAHKYSADPASEIVLNAGWWSNSFVIELRDHGIGISAEDLKVIFEPFFRAESSRTTGGLGLGLALARRIVEAHGGTLTVASSPGRGTTARVELPIGSA